MQRVLLSCRSLDDARLLKNYIETELPYEVFLAFGNSEIESAIRGKNCHLLMMQTGQQAAQDLKYALTLRQNGYNYPILMITDAMGNLNIEELHERHKIYFVERPFELKTLKGLARKLMVSKVVPQQIYRRYRTNQIATLETFISGDRFDTHMFNLSRGGAYFEVTKKPSVAIGDLLRLKVRIADIDREHHIHGRLVWTTHKGHVGGGYGLGLRFMKTSDIYRNLLDRV